MTLASVSMLAFRSKSRFELRKSVSKSRCRVLVLVESEVEVGVVVEFWLILLFKVPGRYVNITDQAGGGVGVGVGWESTPVWTKLMLPLTIRIICQGRYLAIGLWVEFHLAILPGQMTSYIFHICAAMGSDREVRYTL